MIKWLSRWSKVVRRHAGDEERLREIQKEHREEASLTPGIRRQTAVLEVANEENGFVQSLNAGFRMRLGESR